MSRNRHAADRLHDVRAEIKALETEADELRGYLQQNLDDLVGVTSTVPRSVPISVAISIWKALNARSARRLLQRFTSLKRIAVVRLREREGRDAA